MDPARPFFQLNGPGAAGGNLWSGPFLQFGADRHCAAQKISPLALVQWYGPRVGEAVCSCSLLPRPGGPGYGLPPADRDRSVLCEAELDVTCVTPQQPYVFDYR